MAQQRADEANQTFNDYKQQEDQNLADKVAGEKAGYQYGETGATLPSLEGKSEAYKNAFSEGFTKGAAVHEEALAAPGLAQQRADEANETFNDFKKQEDQDLADKVASEKAGY
ncbi:hypothetical protein [Lacticaseibacillus thailandensis]|uniref:hypothetical protein n=1 Tax=Lacticaseibacillus thailandensis TaxID=381741 RepID=UPI0012E0FC11|nr:hypothetical protein [Lacticaseibacillus thailandensis]